LILANQEEEEERVVVVDSNQNPIIVLPYRAAARDLRKEGDRV
jgi:hypothetical protein